MHPRHGGSRIGAGRRKAPLPNDQSKISSFFRPPSATISSAAAPLANSGCASAAVPANSVCASAAVPLANVCASAATAAANAIIALSHGGVDGPCGFEDDDDEFDAEEENLLLDDDEDDPEAEVEGSYIRDYLEKTLKTISGKVSQFYANNRDFWIRPPKAIFSSAISKPNYQPDIFVWSPGALEGGTLALCCIHCQSKVSSKGWSNGKKQTIARRVVCLERCFYIFRQRYLCSNPKCAKTFSSCNPTFLKSLPEYIQNEFPAIMTSRGAVSKLLANLLRPLFNSGIGPYAFHGLIQELHTKRHHQTALSFYNRWVFKNVSQSFQSVPHEYSRFDGEYGGFCPSANYFKSIYIRLMDELRTFQDAEMTKRCATQYNGDHMHSIPKWMAKVNGVPRFHACWNTANQYEEIVGQQLVFSTGFKELEPSLRELGELNVALGIPCETFALDNCCFGRDALEKAIPSLKEGIVQSPLVTHSALELGEDWVVSYCNSAMSINTQCSVLLESLIMHQDPVVGFDLEWPPPRGKVALVQVADPISRTIYLFHLVGSIPPPHALRSFLENASIGE